jgi:hypothetical protein
VAETWGHDVVDELERAIRQRDLGLLAEPRSRGVQPRKPGLLDLPGGIGERLAILNQFLNPVEAIGQSMRAGERMVQPNMGGYDRLAALGDMLSGVAGVAGPAVAAGRAGLPAATAIIEGLLGGSPTTQAAGDMARQFGVDESGALRLFHGSPHDFDRFSMSKIGTGEGALAYGHGLYFAEAEDVAKGYRDALRFPRMQSVPDTSAFDEGLALRDQVIDDLNYHRGSVDAVKSSYENMLRSEIPEVKDYASQKLALLDDVNKQFGGRMYEVNVNANPEDFINFDAPFEQQPPNVQKHFGYLARGERKPTGEDLARRMESNVYIQEAAQAGIPGIRYLDEGSRNQALAPYYSVVRESDGAVVQQKIDRGSKPEVPEGFRVEGPIDPRTRNYVVFDENLIEIVRKYGIAGAAAMLGISQADVAQAMQQQPQGLLSGAQ